jgi:hypothetical protein
VIKGKTLRHTLDKFLKNSEVAKEARVQVCLPKVSSDSYRDEKLYEGSRCLSLAADGLRLEACCLGLESIYEKFRRL